jgi:hypothetical protein
MSLKRSLNRGNIDTEVFDQRELDGNWQRTHCKKSLAPICQKCLRPMVYDLKYWKEDGTYTNYKCPHGCDEYTYVDRGDAGED